MNKTKRKSFYLFIVVKSLIFLLLIFSLSCGDNSSNINNKKDGGCIVSKLDCGANGICDDSSGLALCICDEGYSGDNCKLCAENYQDNNSDGICNLNCNNSGLDCGANGVCDDSSGLVLCVCNEGYSGDNCKLCAENYQDNNSDGICNLNCNNSELDCGANGVCDDSLGEATCICQLGYTGDDCNICDEGYQDNNNDGVCNENCDSSGLICHNGNCNDNSGLATCICNDGSSGGDCNICNEGYQDNDNDGVCKKSCLTANLNCENNEICYDASGTAECKSGHILFAHGLNSSSAVWDTFAVYAESKNWVVHRFDVAKRGSIETRASSLADKINRLNLKENSLIVVGHSMGGLDLHYIISQGNKKPTSKYNKAAKTFKRYYTIASPHKGNQFSGLNNAALQALADLDGDDSIDWLNLSTSDAVRDLGISQMKEFNENYPYSTFFINGRRIPTIALRFACELNVDNENDGIVALARQSLNGAPHSKKVYIGKHINDACHATSAKEEQKDLDILDKILENYNFETETHDIVFYEGENCQEGEKGVFSSYDNVNKSCTDSLLETHNNRCDNDEIRSVRIYPGVKKNLNIYVYDKDGSLSDRYQDDWAVINTGSQDFKKSICINTFEQNTTSQMSSKGLSMFYHKGTVSLDGNWLDGKISHIKFSTAKLERVLFFEGNSCEQNMVGYFNTESYLAKECSSNYTGIGTCKNDEIKSVLIFPGVKDKTIIKLYDSPNGSLSDDWFFINRGIQDFSVPFCVSGLEHNTSDREKDAGVYTYWRDRNGLNGKVSYVKISETKDAKLVFYESSYCGQDVRGLFEVKTGDSNTFNKKCDGYNGNGTCQNDEIKSILIQPGVRKGVDISLFDSPSGSHGDDWTEVHRGWDTFNVPFCINGLEHDTSTREDAIGVSVNYHSHNGLNGKVSRIKIGDNL